MAWAAAVSPRESDDWTWGELLAAVNGQRERERQRGQQTAVIAFRHAVLVNRAFAGGSLPEVWEAFPFWTEDEMRAAKTEKYRHIMERHAAQGVRKHG